MRLFSHTNTKRGYDRTRSEGDLGVLYRTTLTPERQIIQANSDSLGQ